MNTTVKVKYLDDYTNELQERNKKGGFTSGKDANLANKEMQRQTLAALSQTINKMSAGVDEYNVEQIDGNWIRGPMKWLLLVFGPNHKAKDLKSLQATAQLGNINIICLLITNRKNSNVPVPGLNGSPRRPSDSPKSASLWKKQMDKNQQSLQMDYSTKHLNYLCSKTSEGYLVSIDQSKFEGFSRGATKSASKSQT